jgi:hypothetical protein
MHFIINFIQLHPPCFETMFVVYAIASTKRNTIFMGEEFIGGGGGGGGARHALMIRAEK